jgi:oligoribonuclease NrnB/cAMP/cGMP phosphodiesterase (DHH superfamily)
MEIKDKITTIVSHKNCPDGKASAIVLKKVFPEANFVFLTPSSKEHLELQPTPGMLFCDFCPHPDTYQQFIDTGAYVLDHHKHAKDIIAAFGERGVFADEEKEPGVSGAVLAFREIYCPKFGYNNTELYRLVTLVGIRDCYVKSSPLFEEACKQSAMLHFYNEEYILNHEITEADYILGDYIFANSLKKAKETADKKLIITNRIAVMAGTDTTDVADFVFDNNDVDILAGFRPVIEDRELKVVVSMRSRGAADVGAIAKANGGGGHTRAAGFSFPLTGNPFDDMIDKITRAQFNSGCKALESAMKLGQKYIETLSR